MGPIQSAWNGKTGADVGLILLAFIAFVSLGLPEGLLGVAWPSIRAGFSRPLDSLGVLLAAHMAGYLTASFLSGRLIVRLGVGRLLAASCAAAGAGLAGYTLAPAWAVVVACGILTGLGAGTIDASLNTYMAANFGRGLMQWMHACWGIGISTGPVIMTAGITLFGNWRWGYVWTAAAQFALAAGFALTHRLWRRRGPPPPARTQGGSVVEKASFLETLRQSPVRLSILLFFLCAGIEATVGNWIYTLLTGARGLPARAAGLWTGGFWAVFTASRVLAGLYAGRIGTRALIRLCLLGAAGGAALLWWNPSVEIGLCAVVIIGFSMAPVFPGLVSGTRSRVGPFHEINTIGMQIGGAGLGAAILPGIGGVLARRLSLEVIPLYLACLAVALLGIYLRSLGAKAGPDIGPGRAG